MKENNKSKMRLYFASDKELCLAHSGAIRLTLMTLLFFDYIPNMER